MSDTNLIIDQTKTYGADFGHIFRSSAIFFIPKDIKTTISISNYWDFKNKKTIGLLVSLRDKAGNLKSRTEKYFKNESIINIVYKLKHDHSVEIEAFGNENIKIPYAAVMGVYEDENSICLIHSYSRNHSLIELEDKQSITSAKESCWTLKPQFENKAIFHNGHVSVDTQIATLIITNYKNKEKEINFNIPRIKPYETIEFSISKIYKDYLNFLEGKYGFATIHFKNSSSFTRLMLIWQDKKSAEFQATHSNFDYSTYKTNNIKSKRGGEMVIPRSLHHLESLSIVTYPKFQKGNYQVELNGQIKKFKNGFIEKINNDETNIIFSRLDADELPSRIVTGIQGKLPGQTIPFECSTGIFHEKTPAKRFWWSIVSGKYESKIYVTKINAVAENKDESCKEFIFTLYSAATEKKITSKINISNSNTQKYCFNLLDIFKNYKDFLKGDFGYVSLFDLSHSHHIFTSIQKNQSISFEHGF